MERYAVLYVNPGFVKIRGLAVKTTVVNQFYSHFFHMIPDHYVRIIVYHRRMTVVIGAFENAFVLFQSLIQTFQLLS